MRLIIEGHPAPQGSKNSAIVNGRVVMWEASASKVLEWRRLIKQAAHDAFKQGQTGFKTEPLIVEVTFILPRPKTNKRQYPTTKPDIDKLIRATLDGLTLAHVWLDDCQIVAVNACKVYESPTNKPGAIIEITPMDRYL